MKIYNLSSKAWLGSIVTSAVGVGCTATEPNSDKEDE